jgi:hypothetical protein
MTQPNVGTDSRFTFRIDFPDLTDEMFVKCSYGELPDEVQNIVTHLSTLTVDEAPMIVEVRRTR